MIFLACRKYGESQIEIDSQKRALDIRNQMKSEIRFGVVQWFDAQGNLGGVKISGEPVEADFSLDSRHFLVEGWNAPEFGPNAPILAFVPQKGSNIACVLRVEYKLEVTPSKKTLRRMAEVVAWDFEDSYAKIEQRIASRPVFEVVEFLFYKGEPTSRNQRRGIIADTAQGLHAVYPRGVEKDPLAPEFQSLDLTHRRRFYKRMPDGRKVQCPDPRPRPAGMPEEPFQPTNEEGELLASKEEVAQFVSSRRKETRELIMA